MVDAELCDTSYRIATISNHFIEAYHLLMNDFLSQGSNSEVPLPSILCKIISVPSSTIKIRKHLIQVWKGYCSLENNNHGSRKNKPAPYWLLNKRYLKDDATIPDESKLSSFHKNELAFCRRLINTN